ncbi:hypothetical protein B0H13DRAFT_2668963 [Mycena leptocephala]|nr:hypothetical protein B0H13DRAFT_2668963 [Mycena leptocephala]
MDRQTHVDFRTAGATDTTVAKDGPPEHHHASAFFPGAQYFTITGGTFTSITNVQNMQAGSTDPGQVPQTLLPDSSQRANLNSTRESKCDASDSLPSPSEPLSAADHFQGTTFPDLRQLHVVLLDGVDDLHEIQSLCAHSGSDLECVSMRLGDLSSLTLLLRHTPTVTDLHLRAAKRCRHTLASVMTILELEVLPRLENLIIENPHDYEAGCDALVKMLHDRRDEAPGRVILQTFTLVRPGHRSLNSCPFGSLERDGMRVTMIGHGVAGTTGGRIQDFLLTDRRPGSPGQIQFLTIPLTDSRSGSPGLKGLFKKVIRRFMGFGRRANVFK